MIEIYGKPMCPFCDKAKQLCENRKFDYTYKSLGTDFQVNELLEMFPGAKTVPQIKINGKAIGGWTEFEKYVEDTGYNGTGHSL
jgi:glutaredoxin 1